MPASESMRIRGLVLLIALFLAPGALAADARTLLARMATSMRTGAYEGTLVYQRSGGIQTLSMAHAVLDGVEHERLVTLSGTPFEVIRIGQQVTCVWPSTGEAIVARRPEELLPTQAIAHLAELPDAYTAEVVGHERAAGREAYVIAIRPRDNERYGYRMWIGSDDHLLLRSDLVGPDGAALERMLFTRLQMESGLSADRFRPAIDEADYSEHYSTSTPDHAGTPPDLRPDRMPAGFRAISHRELSMPGGSAEVLHSVYTDGLASVSVFVEPAVDDTVALEGLTYMGAVHAYGRRVGGRQVTVVGELPAATIRGIAESVRPHGVD